jgi:S1-C subfamily serine protease
MKKLKAVIATAVLAVVVGASALLASCSNPAPSYAAPRAAVVQLFDKGSKFSGCSGVMVAPLRLLTANHCLGEDGKDVLEATPQRLHTKVLRQDKVNDLVLLEVALNCPCVPVAGSPPALDQQVVAIGFPINAVVGMQIATEGRYQGIGPVRGIEGGARLRFTAPIAPGNSGGGVFAKASGEWRLVGISTSITGPGDGTSVSHLAFASDTAAIRLFLDFDPRPCRRTSCRHRASRFTGNTSRS